MCYSYHFALGSEVPFCKYLPTTYVVGIFHGAERDKVVNKNLSLPLRNSEPGNETNIKQIQVINDCADNCNFPLQYRRKHGLLKELPARGHNQEEGTKENPVNWRRRWSLEMSGRNTNWEQETQTKPHFQKPFRKELDTLELRHPCEGQCCPLPFAHRNQGWGWV